MNRPSREDIVAAARAWIGTPYVHQASSRGAGTDCLGLVRGVYRDLYGEEPEIPPPYSADWAEATGSETLAEAARRHLHERSVSARREGDLLLFRIRHHGPARHAAIASGSERMIHAYSGHNVVESQLGSFWLGRLAYVFSFPGVND